MDGAADVAETTYTPFQTKPDAAPVRLIVRRVKPTPGSQLALFARYSYHAFITDRDGETLELEADHRRHAEVENAIRDLKYGVGLNHMPSGRFAANGAWLAGQVMAHNLARWTARIGLGQQIVTTKTLRRRVFALVGRITRSARRLTLHLPRRWPWETQFRRPMRITMASGEPFAFAGLWDAWRDPKGEVVRSCAIITTSANESLSPIHDRMPVILPRELESLWLDHDIQDPAALDGILRPYPAEAMEVHEVSSMVNSPANDGPEVVFP